MSEYERWYDKDNNLSQFFKFLESLDERNRKVVANEILQIVFCELNINPNEKIQSLSSLKPKYDKRWYDKDIDVQSAVELIRSLTEEERKDLLDRIIDNLRQFIIKGR